MKERAVVKKCKDYIASINGVAVKQTGGPFAERGVPDLLCCVRGRFIAAELKAPGKKPTLMQLLQVQRFIRAGALAFVCDNFDDFKRTVDNFLSRGEEMV